MPSQVTTRTKSMNDRRSVKTIIDVLRYRAQTTPNKIVYRFISDDENKIATLTYHELEEQSHEIAHYLLQSAQPGDRSLLLIPPGLTYITAFFGALYAGVVAVPAYPPRKNSHLRRIMSIIKNSQATTMLLTQKIFNLNKKISGVFTNIAAKDIAFLQYTSGSTAEPKGVIISHENLMVNSAAIATLFDHSEKSRGVIWLPPYHDMGMIGGIIQPLYSGFEVTLMSPTAFLQRPIRWLKAISDCQATTSGGNDFSYELCVSHIKEEDLKLLDLSSWKIAFMGAEPINPNTIERFYEKFSQVGFRKESLYPCYGLAEATLIVSGGHYKEQPLIQCYDKEFLNKHLAKKTNRKENVKKLVSCGSVIPHHELIIVDPKKHTICSEKTIGEIWFRGKSVAQGYWNKNQLTQETFHAKIKGKKSEYLKTGDLGFLEKNNLFITGRIKDLIIIAGKNHYAQDIEFIAEHAHSSLRPGYCAAFSILVDGIEKLIIICEIKRTQLRKLNEDEIYHAIQKSVSEEIGISVCAIRLLKTGSLLKTSSGKIQRFTCKQAFIDETLNVVGFWNAEKKKKISPAIYLSQDNKVNVASHLADDIILWLRDYAEKNINSRLMDERRSMPPNLLMEFSRRGLFGMQVSKEYGGIDLTTKEAMRVIEQLAAIDINLAILVGVHNGLGVRTLQRHAKKSIREKLLTPLTSGSYLAAFALTEPAAGSYVDGIIATAKEKNGCWQLNGMKRWNSAPWAQVIHVFVKTVDHTGASQGISGFVVTKDMPGVTVGPEAMTMGWRSTAQSGLILDNVTVSEEYLLGQLGKGNEIIEDSLAYSRFGISIISVGGMKRCIQLLHRFASRRRIETGQLIKNPHFLREMTAIVAYISAYDLLNKKVLTLLDNGEPVPNDITIALKVGSSESFWKSADILMQFLGGRGYLENNLAPQIMRDARILRIVEGASEPLLISLGRNIQHSDQFLSFISHSLDSDLLRNKLKQAMQAIKNHADSKGRGKNPSLVSILENIEISKIAIKVLLLAGVQEQYIKTSNVTLKNAMYFLENDFEKSLLNIEKNISIKNEILNPDLFEEINKQYSESIGDIEQVQVGEDWELDPLLKKKLPTDLYFSEKFVKKSEQVNLTKESLENWIINWVKENKKLEDIHIDPKESLFSYGLDSIAAVKLSGDLEQFLQRNLEPTIVWEYPCVHDLSEYIFDALLRQESKIISDESKSIRTIPQSSKEHPRLSFEQERLWNVEQLRKGPTNNMAQVYHICGLLNVKRLEKVINTIIQRHEILRTAYTSDIPPHAMIQKYEFHLKTFPLKNKEKQHSLEEIEKISYKLSNKIFNIEQVPLFEIQLFQVDKKSHFLLLVFHHIICDIL